MMMNGIIVIKWFLNYFLFSFRTNPNFLHTLHLHTLNPNLSSFLLHFPQQLYSHSQSVPTTSISLSLNQYDTAHLVSYLPLQSINKTHYHCIIRINLNAHYIAVTAIEGCSSRTHGKMHPSGINLSAYCIKIIMASKILSQNHTICQCNLPQYHLYRYHYHILISFF